MTRKLYPHFNHRGRWTCSDGWDFEFHPQAVKHEKILAARAIAGVAVALRDMAGEVS